MNNLECQLNKSIEEGLTDPALIESFIDTMKIHPGHYKGKDLNMIFKKVYSRLNPQTEFNMVSFRKTFSILYSQEPHLFVNINFFGVFRRLCEITNYRTDGESKGLVPQKEAKRIISRLI